jgi:ribose transport system substrate-binding protein
VLFGFNAYPPVQKRGVVADAIFRNTPDIEIIDFIEPDVNAGALADSRTRMEAILAANPEPGSISAVWSAWDDPALGALQAIEAAGREGEGIIITGIDATPQAVDAITQGGNFEASIAQDFAGIGSLVAEQIASYLDGTAPTQTVVYAPTTLVTAGNASEFVSEPAQ